MGSDQYMSVVERAYRFAPRMGQVRAEFESLAQVVESLQPTNVLEIGTQYGGTFYAWCALAAEHGKKISIDLPDGIHGGLDRAFCERRNIALCREFKNVHFLMFDSHALSTVERVSRILGAEKVDFLFIDGDHTYEGVRQDFELYRHFVRPGGLIAFHDINESTLTIQTNCRVSQFWRELLGEKFELNAHSWWAEIGDVLGGIGVLQVPR